MARGGDEPFTLYGLIAESIELPPDRSSITFHLRREARFADGQPITPEDVLFSHAVLKDKGWPYHRSHYGKVAKAEKVGERSVRFTFKAAGDREAPLLLGLMPILPSHKLDAGDLRAHDPGAAARQRPLYGRARRFRPLLVYRRNPDWWARDLPVSRGRFNFDEIRVDYFRDASSLFEAFKVGEIDVRIEDDPTRWVDGYRFAAVADGRVVKAEFDTELPSGMSALVFNTRRPQFQDPRVRRAFILAFDAEWINRSLFNGVYKRTQSYFERSTLSSHGRPADARERALLAPFPGLVKPEVLDGTFRLPGNRRQRRQPGQSARGACAARGGGLQARARAADEGRPGAQRRVPGGDQGPGAAGAELPAHAGAARHRPRRTAGGQRAVLKRGFKSFDFDMVQWTWTASLSPGNEQVNRWSSWTAASEGSLNLAGARNEAADAMIEALLRADSAEDFTPAVRAFDRVLVSGDYVIPLFHTAEGVGRLLEPPEAAGRAPAWRL